MFVPSLIEIQAHPCVVGICFWTFWFLLRLFYVSILQYFLVSVENAVVVGGGDSYFRLASQPSPRVTVWLTAAAHAGDDDDDDVH